MLPLRDLRTKNTTPEGEIKVEASSFTSCKY